MARTETSIPTPGSHRRLNCILESTQYIDCLASKIMSEVVGHVHPALLEMIPCAVWHEGARRFSCHSFVQVCIPPSGSKGEHDKNLE